MCGRLRLIEPGPGATWRAVLALRAVAARAGVAARLDHGRQRRDLRGPPQRLRGARARQGHDISFPFLLRRAGLRAVYEPGGGREREYPRPPPRARVGAQGPDARALVDDVLRGGMLDPRGQPPAVLRRADLAPPAALRDRPAARASCCSPRSRCATTTRSARAVRRRPRAVARARPRRPPRPRCAAGSPTSPGTTSSSPPRRWPGSPGWPAQGPQATWSARRGRDELPRQARLRRARRRWPPLARHGAADARRRASLIRLEDRGPALLPPEPRRAATGEPFELFKFRTMVARRASARAPAG